ncbi:MAG TPA: Lrp/AsnC family transcriptional regulator [Gammaproteobacteria bacterium]|nr:Lrp/AsnC family transcriptional regulator [Gammaproteobacteria bacterium]
MGLTARDQQLVAAIQGGLPLVSRPFAEIGARIGLSENETIERIQALLADGTIKRLGVVVRHHELGYRANAMTVWNIPDDQVDELGRRIGGVNFVTLCYRRPRHLPDWPYNLFSMIHGQNRAAVLHNIEHLIERCGLKAIQHEVLFSRQRFKQCGAHYIDAPPHQPVVARMHSPSEGQA